VSKYLFVYGTLRNEFSNPMAQFLQENATYLCDGNIKGQLYDVGTYPALIYNDNTDVFIKGQIFEMNDIEQIFDVLDPYEGIDDELYIRQIIPIKLENQSFLPCWVYLFNRPVLFLKKIEETDYMEYLNNLK
jgi:gamma-glutamylcyclotransferase (GGCT)/AIG2-like uncharacterized protein YtfP